MTWTYGNSPDTTTESGRKDTVRFLIGDTDEVDQQISDEEISFCLSQSQDDIYLASSLAARAISGKYARQVDTTIDSLSANYTRRSESYRRLALQLLKESKRRSGGMGRPSAGGVSIEDISQNREDSDRPESVFKNGMFGNPPKIKGF